MQNDLVAKLMADARHYDTPDWVKADYRAAAAEIRRLRGLVEEARECLENILCCTPHVRHAGPYTAAVSFDCGDPFDLARATLSRLEPQIEGEGR